jgi:hypothetical protein
MSVLVMGRLLVLITVIAADSGGGSECFWADANSSDEGSSSASSASEKRLVCRVASLLNRPQALPQVRKKAAWGKGSFDKNNGNRVVTP